MGGAAPYWTNYSYDALGNRTKQTDTAANGAAVTTTYSYPAAKAAGPHAVKTMTVAGAVTSYTYDGAGQRASATSAGVTTGYTWSAEGSLKAVGAVSNVYDADGSRIVRSDADGTTVYVGGQEILITTAGAVKATRYYSFAGQTVAVRTGRGLGDGVTSLVADHHGTPVAAIPNGGHPVKTAVARLFTGPFGGVRGGSTAATVPGDTQFLGKIRDASSGLTLVGARFYDERVGAFVSPDPVIDLADPGQWNAYAYAGNSPVSRSDPSGLLAIGSTDDVDVKGKTFKPGASGTVQASPPVTVDPPAEPADFWTDPGAWVEQNQAEIIGAVAGIVVGTLVAAGCLAVTAGAGSVGCLIAGGAAGGAVGGLVTNLWKTQVTQTEEFTWGGLAVDTGMGAVFGALGGLAGAGVGTVAAKVASQAANPVAKGAAQAVSCAVNSFVPGTAVVMASGASVPIENVKLGDEVLATDPATGESGPREVTALITGDGAKQLTTITVQTPDGGKSQLVATDGHPFWVPELNDWVDAGELLPSMWLQTSAGTWVQVSAIEHSQRVQRVHNLTVEGVHTYYVTAGSADVLVHNCGGAASSAGAKTFQTYTKLNPSTGKVYVGRTSGRGSPAANIARRDAGHEYNARGFGASQLDQSGSYAAIRGREQQLIEYYRSRGISANAINGVGPRNPNFELYWQSAIDEFGAAQ